MGVGAILSEAGLIVETMTVKSNEDLEKGEIVENDGAGLVAATNSSKGPFFMAVDAHDYSEVDDHDVEVVVSGRVTVQKVGSSGANQIGRFCEMSSTAGAVTIFDYSSPGEWYDVVGVQTNTSLDADVVVDIRIGVK